MKPVVAGEFQSKTNISYPMFVWFSEILKLECEQAFGGSVSIQIMTGAMKDVSYSAQKDETKIISTVSDIFSNYADFTEDYFNSAESCRVIVYSDTDDSTALMEFDFFEDPQKIDFYLSPENEKTKVVKKTLEQLTV